MGAIRGMTTLSTTQVARKHDDYRPWEGGVGGAKARLPAHNAATATTNKRTPRMPKRVQSPRVRLPKFFFTISTRDNAADGATPGFVGTNSGEGAPIIGPGAAGGAVETTAVFGIEVGAGAVAPAVGVGAGPLLATELLPAFPPLLLCLFPEVGDETVGTVFATVSAAFASAWALFSRLLGATSREPPSIAVGTC